MEKNWKKEVARDAMALGSILFYFIVVMRAVVGEYMPFVYQLLVSLLALLILSFVIKKANQHIARAVPLVVFTSLFYQDSLFTVFAVLLLFFMIASAFYIKFRKREVVKGLILGLIASFVGYSLIFILVG
jgi:hypothetical protein